MKHGINKGDKCIVNDGDVMRNAEVESVNIEAETYDVTIIGLGTTVSNIPFSIWRPIPTPKKTQTEIEMDKYDTLTKIVKQLESCNYETEAGSLNNNVAFLSLKRMASK